MHDKMKAAHDEWCLTQPDTIDSEDVVEWTLNYLREQQKMVSAEIMELVGYFAAHLNEGHRARDEEWEDIHFKAADELYDKIRELVYSGHIAMNGWKLVPEEVTDDMAIAAVRETLKYEPELRPLNGTDVWAAMIAAAPRPGEKGSVITDEQILKLNKDWYD